MIKNLIIGTLSILFTLGVFFVVNINNSAVAGDIGVGIDVGSPPDWSPGDYTDIQVPVDQPEVAFDPYNYNYDVRCNNGVYNLSSCNISRESLHNGSPATQWHERGNGDYTIYPNAWCPTQNIGGVNAAPYSITANKKVVDHKITTNIYIRRTNILTGQTVNLWGGMRERISGQSVAYDMVKCNYPTVATKTVPCFFNFRGNSYYTTATSNPSWTFFMNRTALASDPREPSLPAAAAQNPTCDAYTPQVRSSFPPHHLAFYQVNVSYDIRNFTRSWLTDGSIELHPLGWRQATSSRTNTNYWVHSCRPESTNGNAIEGPYRSFAALPKDRAQYFNSANCAQSQWECRVESKTLAGISDAQSGGTLTRPTGNTSVMRNGEKVNVNFSQVGIYDLNGANAQRLDDGSGTGGVTSSVGVRDLERVEYRTLVRPGSTPFDTKLDVNATNQFFKLYRDQSTTSRATEQFSTGSTSAAGPWTANANGNRAKALSFIWSSDSKDKPFIVQREWRVTGWFRTPQGSEMGEYVNTNIPGYTWKRGTYNCVTWENRNGQRVQTGLLTANSNPVEVVRSINTDEG